MSLFEPITEAEFKREAASISPSPDAASHIQLQYCDYCGCCEDPSTCVWSVQCPECYAPPMQQCTASDGRITGLHQERHDYAKRRGGDNDNSNSAGS